LLKTLPPASVIVRYGTPLIVQLAGPVFFSVKTRKEGPAPSRGSELTPRFWDAH
jgi:hypothetical protein